MDEVIDTRRIADETETAIADHGPNFADHRLVIPSLDAISECLRHKGTVPVSVPVSTGYSITTRKSAPSPQT
jgi:hypothetical protein